MALKKIINRPADFVDELTEALLLAHPERLRAASADRRALVRADAPVAGEVGIVTGGGSGHLPLFLGYVGQGLATGVAVGNVFSSPSAEQIAAATRACDGGAGVLYLYGNYGGDVYNFDLAADIVAPQGIRTATVLGTDDVLSAPRGRESTRRGVAGLFFAYKTAGAAARRGGSLEGVSEIARRTVEGTRTMGVGLSPTILPAAGEPTFTLEEGEMEVGIGIHGEPGSHRGSLETADEITDRFLTEILAELEPGPGDRVAVLVNGLGATPLEELYLIYRRVHHVLAERGVVVHRRYIGEFATSLEMAGASLSVLRLDDERAELLDAPAASPFFAQGGAEPPAPSAAAAAR
ncbi:dihydroxyacetone kinase subunit DhaK, partial [Spinactinospora alkalitolerans]|uniref:dihydroxyacetone kinase subunit DhaK n=1 Tax=Spinactinospora alkalitolerans TaxID=687207 RepID=UPI0031CDC66F